MSLLLLLGHEMFLLLNSLEPRIADFFSIQQTATLNDLHRGFHMLLWPLGDVLQRGRRDHVHRERVMYYWWRRPGGHHWDIDILIPGQRRSKARRVSSKCILLAQLLLHDNLSILEKQLWQSVSGVDLILSVVRIEGEHRPRCTVNDRPEERREVRQLLEALHRRKLIIS